MEQQYAVPSELGTLYMITDNPPVGATLVSGDQYPSSSAQPSLEQRIKVLEKAVSNINEQLGIKTDSASVDVDDTSELLSNLDSSAATTATNNIANATPSAVTTPVSASASSTAATPASSSTSASAAIPSADDIAKQLGDLTQ